MADANVFSQFLREPKSAQEYANEYAAADDARQQNAFNRLVMGEKVQGMQEQNRLRQLYAQNPGATPEQLRRAGFRGEADKAEAAVLSRRESESKIGLQTAQGAKAQAEAAAKQAEDKYNAATRHAQSATNVRSPQDIVGYIDAGIASGVFPAEARQQMLDKASSYGADVERWKRDAVQGAVPVLDQYKRQAEDARQAASLEVQVRGQDTSAATQRRGQDIGATTAREGHQVTREGQRLTDARQREAISKPFEVTGADGLPTLVQQDRNGNIVPVQGYAPKAPKEGAIPASFNKSYVENRQSAKDLDRALSLAASNPKAFGSQNYVPGSQYFDQKGVEARASVANVGSLLIHDRSGAAVTIAEMPRLAPFIPAATDKPETVVKKLKQLREAIEEGGSLMVEAYPSLGKRASAPGGGSKQAAPAIASGTDLGGGFKVK